MTTPDAPDPAVQTTYCSAGLCPTLIPETVKPRAIVLSMAGAIVVGVAAYMLWPASGAAERQDHAIVLGAAVLAWCVATVVYRELTDRS